MDGPCHRDVVRDRIVRDAFARLASLGSLGMRDAAPARTDGPDDAATPLACGQDDDGAEAIAVAAALLEADEAEAANEAVSAAIVADAADADEAEAVADRSDALGAEAVAASADIDNAVDAGVVGLHRGAGRGRGWNRLDREYPLLSAPSRGGRRAVGRGFPAGRAARVLTLAAVCAPASTQPVTRSEGPVVDYAAMLRPAHSRHRRQQHAQWRRRCGCRSRHRHAP